MCHFRQKNCQGKWRDGDHESESAVHMETMADC